MAKVKTTKKKRGGISGKPLIIGRREKEFIKSMKKYLDEILSATMIPKKGLYEEIEENNHAVR